MSVDDSGTVLRRPRHLRVLVGAVVIAGLLASPARAFELTDCRLIVQSFDADGEPLDTAVGDSEGGEAGTHADPFLVDYAGSVRYEGDTGDQVITDHAWNVDVFLVPTPIRGGDENAEQETSIEGEAEVSASIPFRVSGLYFLSGEIRGEGGACRGSAWVRVLADPAETATSIPFWIALVLIAIGLVVAWQARPTPVVAGMSPDGTARAVRRHPVLGGVGGALVGLGTGLLFVMFGVAPLAAPTIIVAVVLFAVIGVVYAFVAPPRRMAATIVETRRG